MAQENVNVPDDWDDSPIQDCDEANLYVPGVMFQAPHNRVRAWLPFLKYKILTFIFTKTIVFLTISLNKMFK